MIYAQLRPTHLSVRVGGSLRRSEEIVKTLKWHLSIWWLWLLQHNMFRCQGSNIVLQHNMFRCQGSNIGLQHNMFRCQGSNIGLLQHNMFRCQGSNIVLQHNVFRCQGSNIVLQHNVFRCQGSNIVLQHNMFRCQGSNIGLQHNMFRCQGSNIVLQQNMFRCQGSNIVLQHNMFRCQGSNIVLQHNMLRCQGSSTVCLQNTERNMTYACVTVLVNLTNSYDKQDIMPEMVELAKFAKQHVPEEHEMVCVPLVFSASLCPSATASLARRPPRERKVPGSNPACAGIFSGSSHTSDLKIGTPVATLPGVWRCRVSTGTGRPGVSILWLNEVERLICNFCLSVAARKLSEQIRPWDTLACCWDIKQPTNKQTNCPSAEVHCRVMCSMCTSACHQCLFVCCLTSQQHASVSQGGMHRQFYVLLHGDRSCRSNFFISPNHSILTPCQPVPELTQ